MIEVDSRVLDQVFRENNTREVLREFLYAYLSGNLSATEKFFLNKIYYYYFESVNTKYRVLGSIYISTNYIFLVFTNYEGEEAYDDFYVIGVNSDGKLFINPTNSFPYSAGKAVGFLKNYIEDEDVLGEKMTVDVPIFSVSDEVIYKVLGYDFDAEGKISEIPHDQNIFSVRGFHNGDGYGYRVQGDVVLEIVRLFGSVNEMVDEYKRGVRGYLMGQYSNLLSLIVMRRIQEILSAYYIHAEYVNDKTLSILRLRAGPVPENVDEILEYGRRVKMQNESVVGIIAKILYNNLDVSDITRRMIIKYDGGVRIKYSNNVEPTQFNDTITIIITFNNGIIISTQLSEKTVANYVDKIFSELNPADLITDTHIKIGRHKITFKSLRRSMIIRTKLGIKDEDDEITIPIRFDEHYWILPGKLKITHMEHGIHEYTIKYPFKGYFKTVNIPSNEFNNKLTEIAIKLLLTEKENTSHPSTYNKTISHSHQSYTKPTYYQKYMASSYTRSHFNTNVLHYFKRRL